MKQLETNASAYARETKLVGVTVATVTTALLDNTAAAGTTADFKAKTVRIAVNTFGIRYTLDGTDPTTVIGEVILASHANPHRNFSYRQARQLKMVRDGVANDSQVEVTFFN